MIYINNPTFIGFGKSLVLVSSVFLCLSLVTIWVVNLPEWTETGVITGLDQTVDQTVDCVQFELYDNVDIQM